MKEYTRHRKAQLSHTHGLETLQKPADMDELYHKVRAMEKQMSTLQASCEHIIQKLVPLDHFFTQNIGLIRKRLTLHDQYLEQNHTSFAVFQENAKLKFEIQQLEKLLAGRLQ